MIYDTREHNCYLETHENDHVTHDGGNDNMEYRVEPMICLWNISKQGNLMKIKEQKFSYPINYQKSNMDNMKMNLSDDLRYICISCMENKPGSEIHFKAWNVKSLKPVILN